MKNLNLLFDGNFLIHKAFGIWSLYYQDRKVSPEENEKRIAEALKDKEKRQVFMRKIIIDFCATVNRFNSDDIKTVTVVLDSHSWRYLLYNDYKYALTRVSPDYYSDFCSMIDEVERLFRKKGVIVSRVDGAEGDDLLFAWNTYYANILGENLVIITGDSDIRQIIGSNTSVFNNNSKTLKFYCAKEKVDFWKEYFFDSDILNCIESVNSVEILLYKVIMGDTSDNIPKLKRGFGKVAFKKFLNYITPYSFNDFEEQDLLSLANFITNNFCIFTDCENLKKEILEKVVFNLKMTWLSFSVYNFVKLKDYELSDLLNVMFDDIKKHRNDYSYNKKYTLEYFYGLTIK